MHQQERSERHAVAAFTCWHSIATRVSVLSEQIGFGNREPVRRDGRGSKNAREREARDGADDARLCGDDPFVHGGLDVWRIRVG